MAAQGVEQGKTIDAGQHDVQQHQVEVVLVNGDEALVTVGAGGDGKTALTEMAFEVQAKTGIVLHQQKRRGHDKP